MPEEDLVSGLRLVPRIALFHEAASFEIGSSLPGDLSRWR
jgi:hypothetical protein